MQFGFAATLKSQHAIKKKGDARQAYVQNHFSTVSNLRQGNGQVGSMQNIVVAYFWF